MQPVTARGKFLFAGTEKLFLRGVTYGPFRPGVDGSAFAAPDIVERDFALMSSHGINMLRTYAVPPRWLLDLAAVHGLRVLVGHAWEQHIAFLEEPGRARAIEDGVRAGVAACAGHPAVLGHAVGNEIPAPIVRWHGRVAVERFIERLYRAAKAEAPETLVTYVNYPTTEYLDLPFLDLVCFNVYLEDDARLKAYIARLQNIANDRPLVMAELGLDALRHGPLPQARSLYTQIRTSFGGGCAGVFVFSWTDDWHRGGEDVVDWSFGLTTRLREPKPALAATRLAFSELPFPAAQQWPRVSVVVCSYNGAATMRECLEHVTRMDYPDYEVIVVDDGSTDAVGYIASRFDVRLIRTKNGGLSRARNLGLDAATGEIVAYIDDDAFPDVHWLKYLAAAFLETNHVAIGGPNIAPPDDGFVASCVARTPGGPTHVLLSDVEAEHLPGCNFAFRTDRLRAIGGFDPQFRTAGDDVDVCWRLQEAGGTLGFSPAAVVWHRRRGSIRTFWRQQKGYGAAEALLEKKWPEKYNAAGHVAWMGRIYDRSDAGFLSGWRSRVYHGRWGVAPFQSRVARRPGLLTSLFATPEWYLIVGVLGAVGLLGLSWRPLLPGLALAVLCGTALTGRAAAAARQWWRPEARAHPVPWQALLLTSALHIVQPLGRLVGRVSAGLSPWRRRTSVTRRSGRPERQVALWSEQWRSHDAWLCDLEQGLRAREFTVLRGGDYDDWDLEVRDSAFGPVRVKSTIEDHGQGRQLVRFRFRPRWPAVPLIACVTALLLAFAAASDGVWTASTVLAAVGVAGLFRTIREHRILMAVSSVTARSLIAAYGAGSLVPVATPGILGFVKQGSRALRAYPHPNGNGNGSGNGHSNGNSNGNHTSIPEPGLHRQGPLPERPLPRSRSSPAVEPR